MQIKNTTIYNKETMTEVIKELTKKYKSIVAGAIGFLVLVAVYYTLQKRKIDITILAIYAISIVFLIVIGWIRVKKYEKNIFQRMQVINHQESVECKYVFDEEKTVTNVDERSNTFFHADIKKIKETSNSYIIIYNGDIFAVVSKNGFEESMQQEFCDMFKKYL